MKAFLMHRECNFDAKAGLPLNARDLIQDLELETLIGAMANDDAFLAEIARSALLQASRSDLETVLYRQAVLKDCLRNSVTVKAIYKVTIESLEGREETFVGVCEQLPGGYPAPVARSTASSSRASVQAAWDRGQSFWRISVRGIYRFVCDAQARN